MKVAVRGRAQPPPAARRRSSSRPPRPSAPLADRGYVDMTDRGAFIVHEHVNYRLYPEDAYLPESLIRRYGLKRGHQVEVLIQPPRDGERCPSVVRIDRVMGHGPRGDLEGHALRGADPLLSPEADPARGRGGPEGRLDAHGRHPDADRLRPARADRRAAAHRQDDPAAEHRQLGLGEQPVREADPPPGRRAARRR